MNPVAYKGNGIIQVMSSGEIINLAANVLEYMASVNSGVGAIGPIGNFAISSNANVIGTFEDIVLQNDTGDPGANIISSSYTFYQELSSGAIPESDPPNMIGYDGSSSSLRSLSTTEYNDLATVILNYCVTQDGPFSYVLANTSPASGTWVVRGSITEAANSTIISPVYFYQKIANDTYTYNRPLKTSGTNLQRFTDQEVKNIAKKVRQRILSTGIGEYKFQETVPPVGTWVEKGSVVDIKFSTIPNSFDGAGFSGTAYDGAVFTDTYTGTVNFGGTYTGTGPGYIGPTPATFTGPSFSGSVTYVGPINPANPGFTGYVGTGPSFSANYTGTIPDGAIFNAAINYTGNYSETTTSTVDYTASFADSYTDTYDSSVVGTTTETVKTFYLWRRIA
jgi:hypothetical protein